MFSMYPQLRHILNHVLKFEIFFSLYGSPKKEGV